MAGGVMIRAMLSERMQRRLGTFLDRAETASDSRDWSAVAEHARAALAIEADNADALTFLRMAEANLGPSSTASAAAPAPAVSEANAPAPPPAAPEVPESFAGGRYAVRRFLGEGGKKRVFLGHDQLLDRDVAFALIKTEGLDDVGRERITREAQAMGRMGTHPHMVSVFDLGEEKGAPYIVTELMGGGDVEGELEKAGGPLDVSRSLEIAKGVARGLAFAHERGIVHRDLKPGNVWLTSDGVAKIGDFGLAVAEGRSRLTQHGLMVGTFGYMPPEQALGNEATAKSDLYSLGCMLYELVTGKQPFTGDTPTSVISQHLNTPPVAPSWHTEHCPPALEDLILALMAKDPATRPASAQAVLAELERIDPDQRSRSHSDSAANPLDRLARGVFVGRERELERLRTALDGALAGRGSLVMLVGEPGIGKTRTTQELETYARMRGAKVLWGRTAETAGAPPYWPWVQAARDYREQTEEEVRRRQYEPFALDLQRILPALSDLFPNLPPPPDAESAEGQFRLYDALSSFLRSVSTETPLLVVLDDLHWADQATLNVLTHLTRDLGRARILVLGTYRDTDLDRRHPLSTALAELNREDLFTRIPLRGLSLAETTDYISRTAGATPTPVLAQRIFEETEGNPFFLSEVVNLITEEGSLTSTRADVQIPEGVRQALGRRLDRLSDDANALLTTLSVAGRRFDHAVALALSEHDDSTTLRLLEEALRARVLEEAGVAGRYQFSHALMQETLLEELSAARRLLLHGRIAEALLAVYGEADRDHLAELAEHYAESAVLNPAHGALAVRYRKRAAESAGSALAWDEAARLYEKCIELVQAAPDHHGENEGHLWLALARAQARSANFRSVGDTVGRAAALLAADRASLVETLTDIIPPVVAIGTQLVVAAGIEPNWVSAGDPLTSYRVLGLLAYRAALTGDDDGADSFGAQARALQEATGFGDSRVELILGASDVRTLVSRGRLEAALARSDALRLLAEEAGAVPIWAVMHWLVSVNLGDFDGYVTGMQRTVTAHRTAGDRSVADNLAAVILLAEWRRGGAAAVADRLAALPDSASKQLLLSEIALEHGDIVEAEARLPSENDEYLGMRAGRLRYLGQACRVAVATDHPDRARRLFRDWQAIAEGYGTAGGWLVGYLDDALLELGDRELIQQYADRYDDWDELHGGGGWTADYLRGAMALHLDRIDRAHYWFERGLEWATKWGAEVLMGRTHFGLAQVAERRGDHALAMQHIDAAGELFARHGAKLYLDQVIARKEILKA